MFYNIDILEAILKRIFRFLQPFKLFFFILDIYNII